MSLVRRIHVDTDPGLDDLLALALALASPELRVAGITTVAGNASVDVVTDNLRRFLALAELEIPIGRGASGPLSLSAVTAERFHGSDGRAGVALPAVEPRQLPAASDVLRHSLVERGVQHVVAIGPLTNLARLVRQDPALFESAEIVWMGGTLSEGNVTGAAEFNCYADPEAASIVLGSGLPVRVLGLDVTRCVAVRAAALPPDPFGSGRMGRFLAEVLSRLMRAERPVQGERMALLHDPCAIAAAARGELFRYQKHVIDVTVNEDTERGRMCARPELEGPEVLYADEVKSHDVVELFLGRLAEWSASYP